MKASQKASDTVPEIVQKYSLSLQKDLKTNSLVDIKKLTNIAREEIKHCKRIAKVISTRIKTASMDEKLPSLYLLDSIIKNIGGEYINEFSGGISDLFFYSFKVQIDLGIQLKYIKLLKTWVTIFGEQTIHEIEERVMKIPHYGPKQFFEYQQFKEKYKKHLIFVNANKFCKSSYDFSQQEWNKGASPSVQSAPNLDWLNNILKTSSNMPHTKVFYSDTSQNEQNKREDNHMVHSLYRNSCSYEYRNLQSDKLQPQSREWFPSDLQWIEMMDKKRHEGIKKRERTKFEEDQEKMDHPNKK